MGLKLCALLEGRRYRVQTRNRVLFGTLVDRETIDGEQYLLFLDEGRAGNGEYRTRRIRAKAIRSVSRDFDDE